MAEKGVGIMPWNFWHHHMIAVGFNSPHRMFSSQDSNLGLLYLTPPISLITRHTLLLTSSYKTILM